jgi:uncharacterized protein (TIGR02145 family)
LYGGFYQWDEMMLYSNNEGAQGICPPGWHVATKNEWDMLLNNNQGSSLAGGFLKKSAAVFGFQGLTSGMYYLNQSWSFATGPVTGSMFWTSHQVVPGTALAYGLNSVNPSVSSYQSSKVNAFSVRCVKD